MSLKTSVHSYNKALDLFKKVRGLWTSLEEGGTDYEYMEALDKVDELKKHVNRIDLNDISEYLEKEGKPEKIETVKRNFKIFKEGAFKIGKDLLAWSYYEDLLNAVPKYISELQKKNPLKYEGSIAKLSKSFASRIANPDNVERYKSNIESIIRGNMSTPLFMRIYDSLQDRSKSKISPKRTKHIETPPEMFSPKGKKEWEKSILKAKKEWEKELSKKKGAKDLTSEKPKEFSKGRKYFIKTPEGEEKQYDFQTKSEDGIVTYFMDDNPIYSYISESFVSLETYKNNE
jgi:hypothetical protein